MTQKNQPLLQKKCVACSTDSPRLRGKELQALYEQLNPGWKIVDERHLEKEYEFPNFKFALRFTNDVGEVAEEEGHHPDIHLAWGKVKIILWTHKNNGLTESDFILAAKCDDIYSKDSMEKPF